MVGRNAGRAIAPLLDLSRVHGLGELAVTDGVVRIGAGVTYTQLIEADVLPGAAAAARTVASRAIRNRATLVGALVLADPSADVLAPLVAAGAELELASAAGIRRVPALDFVRGPGDPDLGPGELVTALVVPADAGPAAYAKAGARNAMARAVCGVAVALDPAARGVRIAVVGCGPRAVLATEAAALAAELGAWEAGGEPGGLPLAPDALAHVGALVGNALDPREDSRGSAAYRRRIAGVLARRALVRAWGAL